jgi:molybdopterin-guanine dinucleotide biosynthesis protein A
MGTDKACLPIRGRPMLLAIADQLVARFREVLVSAADRDRLPPLDYRVVVDMIPGEGPLVAVASVLAESPCDWNLFVTCDIPDIPFDLVRQMFSLVNGRDAVVPMTAEGHYEPLFALYRKSFLPAAQAAIAGGERKIIRVYEHCDVAVLSLPAGLRIGNLNTMADYLAYVGREESA